ncbi:MAG: radical SAM protein [Proteobacteria bacterium]|nr:radical SAM protein [Pseudomonadota bacterium]MBU1583876.1 radical SAM protein [Pseudomonadota bacterium]MBU2452778.1 radical SAM protein [Pseudomonadota bacterium]MBU2627935.1 radical SAM protein [Pseudomonadota bacterium]
MRPISEMSVVQIEVTNRCHLSCAHCTRHVGHHKKPFVMSLDQVKDGIKSLEGFKGNIGLMGGEPAVHPQFVEILNLFKQMVPQKEKREFWTAGYKWDEYKDLIHEVFDERLIAFNDHSNPEEGWHQPLLIAIEEVIKDRDIMWKMIDNCWVQLRWSASITPKGAFFCEVAAAQDHLFDGPGGWKVEKGWWQRTPDDPDFKEQVKRYCPRCSACLPMPMIPNNHEHRDHMSPGNFERLKKVMSPKILQERYLIEDVKVLSQYVKDANGKPGPHRGSFEKYPAWTPWNYRSSVYNAPGEGSLSADEVRKIQLGKKLSS